MFTVLQASNGYGNGGHEITCLKLGRGVGVGAWAGRGCDRRLCDRGLQVVIVRCLAWRQHNTKVHGKGIGKDEPDLL